MQTALMSKTNRKKRIERQCSMYGVCMYVCLYVWANDCTVCMCVHASEYYIKIYQFVVVVVDWFYLFNG